MRVHLFLPIAALGFTVVSNAQNLNQQLQWARQTIDADAVTHHFEPPATSSGTKWQVSRIDGCTVELKEADHRESPHTIFTRDEVFGLSEDKVVTWTFNLGDLSPQFVMADTIGIPHIQIFAASDVFHLKTDVVSRNMKDDGTTASTSNWSTTGSARNLWIYFDSPDADNSVLVKKLEVDLRSAVSACTGRASAR